MAAPQNDEMVLGSCESHIHSLSIGGKSTSMGDGGCQQDDVLLHALRKVKVSMGTDDTHCTERHHQQRLAP